MPRIPIRQQNGLYGSRNIAASARPLPVPTITQKGPAYPREVWTTHASLSPEVKRAIAQMQENVRQVAAQIKALPHGNGNLLENVPLVNGGGAGVAPFTILKHGLKIPFRGYHIMAVRNGSITGHAVIPNPGSTLTQPGGPPNPLDAAQLQLWCQFSSFGTGAVTADIWVYG